MAEPIDEEGVVETAVDLLGDEDSLGEVVNFRGEALGDGNNTPTKTSVGPATVEENEPQHAKANKGPELPVLLDEDVESVVSSNGTTPRPPPKKTVSFVPGADHLCRQWHVCCGQPFSRPE